MVIIIIGCNKNDNTTPAALQVPTLITAEAANITAITIRGGGNITNEGNGTVLIRGVCWSTSTTPTIKDYHTEDGPGAGIFSSSISDLSGNTKYFIRAYATNSSGTGYGMALSFTTAIAYPVTDIDGNVYQTVTIGNQTWMAENLKTTRYRDGTSILYPGVDSIAWQKNTTGAYAWYDNDESTYKNKYGALYNWYAVNTNKLCPQGWYVPSDADWHQLILYLDPNAVLATIANPEESQIAGGKLKENYTKHWEDPNIGATNETGFTAIPNSSRYEHGQFLKDAPYRGVWWTSTTGSIDLYGVFRLLNYADPKIFKSQDYKTDGYPVRCIRY